jgi:class 3 adenylate cyclase
MSSPAQPGSRRAVRTVLFSDLVDSTGLKQRLGDARASELIWQHHAEFRTVLRVYPEATEIDTKGDSFLVLFTLASDAVRFALSWQRYLQESNRLADQPLADRLGLHTGEVFVLEGVAVHKPVDVLGLAVDTAARVMQLAQGNQIFLTRATADGARPMLGLGNTEGLGALAWINHGPRELKGVAEPQEIWQVGETGLMNLQRPATCPAGTSRPLVERLELTPEKRGLLGFRELVVTLPAVQSGERLLLAKPGGSELAWEEVTTRAGSELKSADPVVVFRVLSGETVALPLLFPGVTRDAAGHGWDLLVQPALRVAEPAVLLRAGVRALLDGRPTVTAADLGQWLKPRLEPAVHDRLHGIPHADLVSPVKTSLAFWEEMLRSLLGPLGLAVDLPAAPLWASEAAEQQAQREAARQRAEQAAAETAAAQAREAKAAARLREVQAAQEENERIRAQEAEDMRRRAEIQGLAHTAEMEQLRHKHEVDRLNQRQAVIEAENALQRSLLQRQEREAEQLALLAELALKEQETIARMQRLRRDEERVQQEHAADRARRDLDTLMQLEQRRREGELSAADHAAALAAALTHRPEWFALSEQIRIAKAKEELDQIEARRARLRRDEQREEEEAQERREQLKREQAAADDARKRAEAQLGQQVQAATDKISGEISQVAQGVDKWGTELKALLQQLLSGQHAAAFFKADAAGLHQQLWQQAENAGKQLNTAMFAEKWLQRGRDAGHSFSLTRKGALTRNMVGASSAGGTYSALQVKIGDPNHLELLAPQAGHVTLINPGTSGDFYLLTPNDGAPLVVAQAGERLTSPGVLIPTPGLGPQCGPVGEEYLVAFITPQPLFVLAELAAPNDSLGLSRWDPVSQGPIAPFRHIAPGRIVQMEQQLAGMPPGSWAVGVLRYLVVRA